MKKRLVAFTNLFPRPWEPQRATFNRQQLERLTAIYDLEVLVPIAWIDWLNAKRLGQDTMTSVSSARVCYFRYYYLPKFLRRSYGFSLFLSTLRVLPHLLGQQRPQIIYAPWAYPDATVAVLFGKLLNIPVAVKVLGSDINVLPTIPGVRPQIAWMLRHADAVIAVSQDLARKVMLLGAKKACTKVIYDGVDPTRFKPLAKPECRAHLGLDANTKVIVYVGNIFRAKGCLDLLESFAILKQQVPDALLIYVGKGDDCVEQIAIKAKQFNLEQAVRLVGTQPHEKVGQWMGAADVVVLPSYNEGVPNVLLEAMACGRPIVATTVGGIPEVVPDFAGILVPPGDIGAIAEAIKSAITGSWDTQQILAHVSQFTWERNIAELQAALDSIANAP